MYPYTYNPGYSSGASAVWLIIACVLSIIGGLVIYFTFMKNSNRGKFKGFAKWLYEFLHFRKITVEVIPFSPDTPPEETAPLPGDTNGDGFVDLKDVVNLRRYLAGGWELTFVEAAADVNKDGSLDLKDVVTLRRYLVGGYGITL